MFRFWLDVNKPEEHQLAEHLEKLKRKRQFSRTIRDSLRLFLDLKAGKTDVLQELFPGIAPQMDFAAIIQQAADASAERFANTAPPLIEASGNMSELSKEKRPQREDDDAIRSLEVKKSTVSGEQVYQNIVNSLLTIQVKPAKKAARTG